MEILNALKRMPAMYQVMTVTLTCAAVTVIVTTIAG